MDVPRRFPWLASLAGGEPVSQPLAGQVALVTGAGTGIGAAVAHALAQAGAGVGLLGRRPQPLEQVAAEIAQAGGKGWALPADVTDLAAVEAAVERCQALGAGRLDLLVNNAGINTKYRSLDNISAADWSRVVDINLNGAYWCVRAVLPAMRRQGAGLIVNVSSGAGLRPSHVSGVAYSATKTALASLNGSINQEERRHGIRACVVYPGEVDTPMIDERTVVPSAAARATMMRPDDVAQAILFIATMPARVTIDELVIRPTAVRDRSNELPA